jgi:opacity protein-like surface antigen
MRLRVWNAVIVSFGLLALISPASADFHTDSEARFALLGPRIEAGLIWDVERRQDESICALSESQMRARVARESPAVKQAAFDIWSAAKLRCELRKFGFVSGFHASFGIGGQFDLNSSTATQSIGSADLLDPINFENRKVGLSSSGVVGQIGLGYDWNKPNLFSGLRVPGMRPDGFVGVNLDATFGGGSSAIQGVPGIVPFLTPDMASWDTLRFRNNFNLDLTGRIGAYFSPRTAVYALGGLAISSVNFRYDCAGFCAVPPATPAFSAETTMMTYGGVIGAGLETQLPTSANTAFYIEYRAYLLQPVTLDVGSIATRSTSQQVDLSHQTVIAGARLRF